MLTLEHDEIVKYAANLRECYPDDLEESVTSEFIQFVSMVKEISKTNRLKKKVSLELNLYRLLHEFDMVECFPNVEIALRIYLCMFVTNCTSERSFSKLKLILNYLRNTMCQDRLSALALLSIESEVFQSIDL